MRSLERKIGAICRAVAVKVAEGHTLTKTETLTPENSKQHGGEGLNLPSWSGSGIIFEALAAEQHAATH